MTEQPGQYGGQPKPAPTVASLKTECHRLIEQVAKRPGAAKLLQGVVTQLELFSRYKANRNQPDRRGRAD